jgi:hypothetical protein
MPGRFVSRRPAGGRLVVAPPYKLSLPQDAAVEAEGPVGQPWGPRTVSGPRTRPFNFTED